MARIAGRKGALYVNLTSGGTPQPLAYLKQWSLDFTTGKIDVTGMQDSNMTYVSGFPDAQGSIQGWYDDATVQTYTAAVDGVARKFYLYPNTDTAQYWFGTAILDFSVTATHDGGVEFSGGFAASSVVSKVG